MIDIQYALTTNCDMACPACSWGIPFLPEEKRVDYDLEYILNSAKYLQGVNVLYIMGGEPTLHPMFEEWSSMFRYWFRPDRLYVWTNGAKAVEKIEAFKYYDKIIYSLYDSESFFGSPDNSEVGNILKDRYGDRVQIGRIQEMTEENTKKLGSIYPCGREDIYIYMHGLLYPCCGETYLKEAKGIVLTDNWREDILHVELPCEPCMFAEVEKKK